MRAIPSLAIAVTALFTLVAPAQATTQVSCVSGIFIQEADNSDVQCPDPFGAGDATQARASLSGAQVGIYTDLGSGGGFAPSALVNDFFTISGLPAGVPTDIQFDLLVEGTFSADFDGAVFSYIEVGASPAATDERAVVLIEEPASGDGTGIPVFDATGGIFGAIFPAVGAPTVNSAATTGIDDVSVLMSVTKTFTSPDGSPVDGYLEFAFQSSVLAGVADFINSAVFSTDLPQGTVLETNSGQLTISAAVPLPPAAMLMLAALATLAGFGYRRSGQT